MSMRFFILSVVIFCSNILLAIEGEVETIHFPRDKQVCERAKDGLTAPIRIAGTATETTGYTHLLLQISVKEGFDSVEVELAYNMGVASIDISYDLQADFFNHTFTLFGKTETSYAYIKQAAQVLAGDVIIITGQSNAEAMAQPDTSDLVEYIRGYNNGEWNYLQLADPGLWGARLAHILSDSLGYPIGVFNTAVGGKAISFFMKNPLDSTLGNYGKMAYDMAAAGIEKPIAFFWFQGTSDSWTLSVNTYYDLLSTLHASWKEDFGVDNCFIIQHRYGNCTSPKPDVMEAQRQYAEEQNDTYLLSTLNTHSDSCHYYKDGYLVLGERMAQIVLAKMYQQTVDTGNFSANIEHIYLKDPETLVLSFLPKGIDLKLIGEPLNDFRIEEGVSIKNIAVEGEFLIVKMDEPVVLGQNLSYLGHPGPDPFWVVSTKNVGILTFYNRPITNYWNLVKGTTISCPNDTTVFIEEGNSVQINWNPPITDVPICDDKNVLLIQKTGLPSGSIFGIGHYEMVYEAQDNCVSTYNSNCYFNVYVELDTTTENTEIQTEKSAKISLFPNPASNVCTIKWESNGIQEIKILNTLGQKIFSRKVLGEKEVLINLRGFPKGRYFVVFTTSDGIIIERLLID